MTNGPLMTIAELWDEVLHPPRVATVGGTKAKAGSKPPASLDGLELREKAHELARKFGCGSFRHALRIKHWSAPNLSFWHTLADEFVTLARPEKVEGVFIGKCPQCGDDKRWHEGQTVMVCECGLYGSRRKWLELMQGEEVPSVMTTNELAAFLSGKLSRNVEPTVVRNWQSRKHIQSVGKDERGRTLYAPLQVLEWARAKGEGLKLPVT